MVLITHYVFYNEWETVREPLDWGWSLITNNIKDHVSSKETKREWRWSSPRGSILVNMLIVNQSLVKQCSWASFLQTSGRLDRVQEQELVTLRPSYSFLPINPSKLTLSITKKKVRKTMEYFHLRYYKVVFIENFICSFETKALFETDWKFGEIFGHCNR
jgi:hypothetical protein